MRRGVLAVLAAILVAVSVSAAMAADPCDEDYSTCLAKCRRIPANDRPRAGRCVTRCNTQAAECGVRREPAAAAEEVPPATAEEPLAEPPAAEAPAAVVPEAPPAEIGAESPPAATAESAPLDAAEERILPTSAAPAAAPAAAPPPAAAVPPAAAAPPAALGAESLPAAAPVERPAPAAATPALDEAAVEEIPAASTEPAAPPAAAAPPVKVALTPARGATAAKCEKCRQDCDERVARRRYRCTYECTKSFGRKSKAGQQRCIRDCECELLGCDDTQPDYGEKCLQRCPCGTPAPAGGALEGH